MDDYVRCSLPCSCLRWRILLVPQNDTQRNFLFFFCFSRFEYCIRRIYILDSKNIYIIHHALECTFRMGQRVFSNCISPWFKRMAKRCHRVGITPIYFSPVWQERSSYRLIKRRENRLRCSRFIAAAHTARNGQNGTENHGTVRNSDTDEMSLNSRLISSIYFYRKF